MIVGTVAASTLDQVQIPKNPITVIGDILFDSVTVTMPLIMPSEIGSSVFGTGNGETFPSPTPDAGTFIEKTGGDGEVDTCGTGGDDGTPINGTLNL